MSHKVPVYAENPANTYERVVVARVEYNRVLDRWNGSNMQYGGTGFHGGLTKLRRKISGKQFVFIHGTQWSGGRNYGYLIDDDEALSLILESENEKLLNRYFPWYIDPEEGAELELPTYRELAECLGVTEQAVKQYPKRKRELMLKGLLLEEKSNARTKDD